MRDIRLVGYKVVLVFGILGIVYRNTTHFQTPDIA